MARKNNKIIYDEVYHTTLLQFGLWDQVWVDHGKEFYLLLYIQEQLGRGDLTIAPYVRTTSTQNLVYRARPFQLGAYIAHGRKGLAKVTFD